MCDASCFRRTKGCTRQLMDTRCPAMHQGWNRKVRAVQYMKYLQQYYSTSNEASLALADNQQLYIIPGIGHNETLMFTSYIGLNVILGKSTKNITPTAQCNICNGDPNAILRKPTNQVVTTINGLYQVIPCQDLYELGKNYMFAPATCSNIQKQVLIPRMCGCSNIAPTLTTCPVKIQFICRILKYLGILG